MTKKMFQVTRVGMMGVTIFICLNLLLDKKVMLADSNVWERCGLLLFSLLMFVIVSILYERKRRVFSAGYLFILINVFIDGILCPGYFTDSRLREMEREGVQETGFLSALPDNLSYPYGFDHSVSVMCKAYNG